MPPSDESPAVGFRALPGWLVTGAAGAACVLLLALATWWLSGLVVRLTVIVVPVLLSLFLAAIFQPLVDRLHHPRLAEWVVPLLAVLVTLTVIVGVFWLTGTRVAEQLSELRQDAAQLRQEVMQRTGLDLPPLPDGASEPSGDAGDAAQQALGIAIEILVGLFLTLALGFLFLKDGAQMWRWVVDHTGAGIRDHVDAGGRAAWSTLAVYVRGLTIVAAFDAAAIAVGLMVLGVPLVLTLAILQFFGSYIPTFGAFVAGAVAVAVALLSGGWVTAALTLLLIVAVQQIGNNVIEPWVMGRTLPLHAAVVLIAVTTGAILWGIAGAFFFVPLAAAITAAVHAVRVSRSDQPA